MVKTLNADTGKQTRTMEKAAPQFAKATLKKETAKVGFAEKTGTVFHLIITEILATALRFTTIIKKQ